MLRFRQKLEAAVRMLSPEERDSVLVDAMLAMSQQAHRMPMTDEELATPPASARAYQKLNELMAGMGCPHWFDVPNSVQVYCSLPR
jgi:hypothetical protein